MFHIRCVMNIYRGIIGKRKASLAAVSSILHYIILYYIILYWLKYNIGIFSVWILSIRYIFQMARRLLMR